MTLPVPFDPGGLTPEQVRAVAAILRSKNSERAMTRALQQLWGWYGQSNGRKAVIAAVRLSDPRFGAHVGTRHQPRIRGLGRAAREIQKTELVLRSMYVYNSAHRLMEQLSAGKTLEQALQRERVYHDAHEVARKGRQAVANRVDAAADKYGVTLGWWAHEDDKTTPECRAADGTNFVAGHAPRIGYPGSVHRYCRCSPGPPHATILSVDDATDGIRH